MILRARIVLPVTGPAIENGAVEISDGIILSVGKADPNQPSLDLGEVILFPGFVNAHCHLDYTSMAGKLSPPKAFPDWIKSMLSLKAHYSYTDYAESWMLGARQLLQTGTTTVADIEAGRELLAESLPATPLKVFTFLEMTGVKSGRTGTDIVRESLNVIESLPSEFQARAGLSPHSPYSTHPDLLAATVAAAKMQKLLITSHVAESKPEWDMFVDRSGPLFNWLRTQRHMEDCGGVTPLEQLDRTGILNEQFLAVHANYLSPGDIDKLANRSASVVHCPRSHQYFGHAPFPFSELRERGVNVCLGTDSLASVRPDHRPVELSMFEEMQLFSTTHPEIHSDEVIRMATSNGAKALGHASDLGMIAPNASADLAAIPFNGNLAEAPAAVVNHRGRVTFSMIEGRCVYPPNTVD